MTDCRLRPSVRALAGTVLALAVSPSCAATGDRLPPEALRPVLFEEGFDRSVASLEQRYRLGISPWPDAILTRSHLGSGEQEIWTGGNFAGLGIQPLETRGGTLLLTDRPLNDAAKAKLGALGDQALARGRLKPKFRASLSKVDWSAGALASKESWGDAYYEVKMRPSPVQGRWQSFYLFDWQRKIEIDIVEAVGKQGGRCYNFSTHGKAAPAKQTQLVCTDKVPGLPNRGTRLSDGFRSYGVYLTGNRIKAYLDRIEVADMPMPDDFVGARWSWVLNLAVGGWPTTIGQPPQPGSSATMAVDHIRISGK